MYLPTSLQILPVAYTEYFMYSLSCIFKSNSIFYLIFVNYHPLVYLHGFALCTLQNIQQNINTHFNFVFQEVENRRLRREKEDKEGVPGNRKNKKNNMKEINDYDE